MKIAILGGMGFIGQHLAETVLENGHEPILFDRIKPNTKIPEGCTIMLGDVRNREAVNYVVGHADRAINLAGILGTSETVDNPFPSAEVNIIGGLNFLQACREHNKQGVQIAVGNHFMNNSYAITKTTTERFSLMYNKEHGTKVAVVRALNAYGERQKASPVRKIIPSFITRALRGESIEIFGNGKSIMDMIYVKDVADVLYRAAIQNHGVYDSIFEAGTGVKTTVNDIAQVVSDNIPGSEITHTDMRAGETKESIVLGNPKTLKPLYAGKTPKLAKLEETMPQVVAWYQKELK